MVCVSCVSCDNPILLWCVLRRIIMLFKLLYLLFLHLYIFISLLQRHLHTSIINDIWLSLMRFAVFLWTYSIITVFEIGVRLQNGYLLLKLSYRSFTLSHLTLHHTITIRPWYIKQSLSLSFICRTRCIICYIIFSYLSLRRNSIIDLSIILCRSKLFIPNKVDHPSCSTF